MNRLLLVVVVLYLVWRMLSAHGRRMAQTARGADDFSRFSGRRQRSSGDEKDRAPTGDDLVPCGQCGVLVPSRRLRAGPDGRPSCEACAVNEASGERPNRAGS